MNPSRSRISASESPDQRADDVFREQHELDKREAAQEAIRRNGGRSAPPSALNRPTGKTEESTWREMFPRVNAYTSSDSNTATPSTSPAFGHVTNPPPMQHSGAPGSEGAILPSTARDYKGISAYNDPKSGGARVIEYDPSKDMRYSNMGVTSGANTAEGILGKYQTHGTVAKFTPGTVTDNSGNVAQPNGQVWNRDAARASLYAAHPEVWQAGTEKNKAFADYAAQHGEQAAHENINQILAPKPISSETPMPPPGPKTTGPDTQPQINAYA